MAQFDNQHPAKAKSFRFGGQHPGSLAAFASELEAATVPEWVHLLPAGRFIGRDGRGPYQADPAEVIRNTRAYHKGNDLVIDYDHQAIHAARRGGSAPAAGWIKDLEARPDGVWGQVEWTEAAHAKIAAREYRYLSPVFPHGPGNPATVGHIYNVALVNVPNLDLMALNAAHPSTGENPMSLQDQLAALLGLDDATADEAALLKALETRLNAPPDPRKYVPVEQVTAMLNDMQGKAAEMTQHEAARQVEAAISHGTLPPALRDWGVALCSADPQAFQTFAAKAPRVITPGAQFAWMNATPPRPPSSDTGTPEEQALSRQLGISVADLRSQS